MKWSTRILIALSVIIIAGLLVSNIILKDAYNKIDKNDVYWTYGKVLEEHFKYVKIEGGNTTNIAFEQSPNCSVRILHDWQRVRPNPVDTYVKNDTLYIKFTYTPRDEGERDWVKRLTLVRVFSPELPYVEGFNTNFRMFKLKQSSIAVNMSGRSKFEVESFIPDFDSLQITQKDSSEIVFEMSPEYKPTRLANKSDDEKLNNNESFRIQRLSANLQGNSILDVGHGKIKSLDLNITDTSAIVLSGAGLRTFCTQKF
jgi:hypothetical protein